MEIDDRINRLSTDRKLANIAAAIPGAGDRPVAPRMAQSDPRMAQGDPRMAQGDPRMLPSSGLAGISPPSAMPMAKGTGIPQAIEKPDPMQIMGGVAMAVLAETSKPTKNIIQKLADSAGRTGVEMPDMSPESGGLPTMLAAGGGRVVYRRDSGPVDNSFIENEAKRASIIQQIRDTAQNYGVATDYWDLTKPLSLENNPTIFNVSGNDPASAGDAMGQLVSYQYPGYGVPQNQIGDTTYAVQQGFGGFRADHERLLAQLEPEVVEEEKPIPFQPIKNERYGYPSTDTDTGTDIVTPSVPVDPQTLGFDTVNPDLRGGELVGVGGGSDRPRRYPETDPIDIFDQNRYGGLGDPNLRPLDQAQLRHLYRQQVGFFDTPPGPTDNTRRLLDQAYGDDSPIYAEILGGLQPDPRDTSEEAARIAYYNLPGNPYPVEEEVVDETVTAAGGGGLYELAAGGEFSGRVPGDGGGMQDNVRMPIKEGANQVATLAVSPTEYVVDSHTMAALGNGNPDKGADHMDNVIKGIRRQAYGNDKQPNQINGLRSLRSMMG
jgi:hypothetical protein